MIGPLCPNCLERLEYFRKRRPSGNYLACDHCHAEYPDETTVDDLMRQRIRATEAALRELVDASDDEDAARYAQALKQARAILGIEEKEG